MTQTAKKPGGHPAFANTIPDLKLSKPLESCKPEPLIDEETARGGVPAPDELPTLEQRAERFHEENPHFYQLLVDTARERIRRTGDTRLGIAQLFEVVRWGQPIVTTEPAPKANNSYRAWFARKIMDSEPDLAGVFEVRRSGADSMSEAA